MGILGDIDDDSGTQEGGVLVAWTGELEQVGFISVKKEVLY